MPLVLSPLLHPTGEAFSRLLDLYQASFPPEEQKSPAALVAMLHNPIYRFLIAHHSIAPGTPLGFAVAAHPVSAPVALLEYLATAPAVQGQGIGRALFTHCSDAAARQQRPLLLEVETEPTSSADTLSPQARRRRFYRSLGARELTGLHYRMPAVSGGDPPPMHLFLHIPHPPAPIPRDTVHTWLTALYTEVYQQPPDDPRIPAMLSPLPPLVALT